ncbi:hypothetical protein A3Q56_08528, partial [Intoshia linei]
MIKSCHVRNTFLNFYKSKNHTYYPSSSCVASDADGTLFVNAGINQFKSVILSKKTSILPSNRIHNYQKCIRLTDVKKIVSHFGQHSFFEMMGAWSFNNNYSEEVSILMANEFITKKLQIPIENIVVSIVSDANISSTTKKIWRSV